MSDKNRELGQSFEEFAATLLANSEVAGHYQDALDRLRLIELLVECRKEAGLPQSEVARRMGVSQPTVAGFERDATDPRLSSLQRYARAVDRRLELTIGSDPRIWRSTDHSVYRPGRNEISITTTRGSSGTAAWRAATDAKRLDFGLAA